MTSPIGDDAWADVKSKSLWADMLKITARLGVGLLAMAALWTLSLPLYVDLVIAAILLRLGWALPTKDFVVVTTSMFVGVVLVGLFAKLLIESNAVTAFYREHEKYVRPGQFYQPNVDDVISQPHGDLLAIDPFAPTELREPRTVHFRTDSLGFRNSSDYHGQRVVLVGDSFVVGNGTDGSETLPAQLLEKFGINAYSIAFPSAPRHYEERAAWFQNKVDPDARFAFFFYEGNDFINTQQRRTLPRRIGRLLDRYDSTRHRALKSLLPFLPYYPLIFNASLRLERAIFARDTPVSTYRIRGHLVGFFDPEKLAVYDANPALNIDANPNVIRNTSCIFFVPSKFRVYRDELPLEMQERIVEPPPSYQLLVRTYAPFDLKVIDLTPYLRAAAKTALDDGNFVFWRDDSHWNGRGIAAVTEPVAHCLRERALNDGGGASVLR